jgi:hypothetical protein
MTPTFQEKGAWGPAESPMHAPITVSQQEIAGNMALGRLRRFARVAASADSSGTLSVIRDTEFDAIVFTCLQEHNDVKALFSHCL